jgi:hypothetical protein
MQMRRRIGVMLGSLLLVGLGGCVVTQTSGSKLAGTEQPIQRMAVVVQRAVFEPGNVGRIVGNPAADLGNKEVEQLFPHLANRLPVVLSLNRVESKAAYVDADATLPAELEGFRFVLRVYPRRSTWTNRSGNTLTIDAELLDRQSRQTLWRGDVLMGATSLGKYDAAMADEIATKLVAQMRHDGVALARAAAVPAAAVAATKQHVKQVPPATGFAAATDVDAVPLRAEGKDRYRHYLGLPAPKAFIIYETGGWRMWSNDRDAMTHALDFCANEGKRCWLYAVDDRVVWSPDVDKRIGSRDRLSDR